MTTTMRSANLIGAKVVDNGGVELGKVHDIRTERDGQHEVEAPYVVTHLLVSGGTVGTRLGYGYGHMHGPWPLSNLMRRAMRNGYAVRWREIESVEPALIRLNVACAQLTRASEILGEEGEQ